MRKRRINDLATHRDDYVTVTEFAQYLTVSQKTVRKWIKVSVLPGCKFEREWRIQTTEAIAFIERARFQGTPDAKARG